MKKRLLSMVLVLSIVLTMLPIPAMAEEAHTTISAGKEIIEFEQLEETEKTVKAGTYIEDLELPETLAVTVRTEVTEQTQEDNATDPEWEETITNIPVTWIPQSGYDMDTEGEYVFTPVIEEYTISAELPEIKVIVDGARTMARSIEPQAVGGIFIAPITIGSNTNVSWQFVILTEPDDETNGTVMIYSPYSGTEQHYTGDLIIPETVRNSGKTYEVTEISTHTFNSCKMSRVFIPKTISGTIGQDSFNGSNNIISFIVDPENSVFCSDDGVLYNKDKTILIKYPPAKTGETFIIPESVTTLSGGAFTNSKNITFMDIPKDITFEGSHLFYGSSALTEVIIGEGVRKIPHATFSNCNSLEIITFKGTTAPILDDYSLISSDIKIKVPARSTGYIGESASDEWKSLADKIEIEPSSEVAQIGSKGYANLQYAFNEVEEGQTIELLDNIILDSTVTIAVGNNKSFTLDLNGKTINSGSNMAIQHNGAGTLTIKDSDTNGKITSEADEYKNDTSYGTIDLRGGNLVVESGTIENTLDKIGANAILKDHGYNGTVILTGGTIISNEGTAIYYGYISGEPTSPSGIIIPSGTSVIRGGYRAMSKAPDLSSYNNVKVTASYYFDGSNSNDYNADDISLIYDYNYLRFEPATPSDVLTGTATISNTAPRVGDVMIGSLMDSNNSGTLTYVWKADGREVNRGESYTVTIEDLGKEITLEISSSVETGTITSTETEVVLKKAGPATPAAPILTSKTYNTITLTANEVYEFSMDGITWQKGNVFSGLNASTTYTFYQRIAETDDTESSPSSIGFSVTTNSNYSGNSDSKIDRSSNDNSSNIIIIRPTAEQPNRPTQGEIEVTGKSDNKGNVIVNITDKNVIDIFNKANADAKKYNNEQNGISVVFRVDTGRKTGSNVIVNLPKTVQDTIIAKKIDNTIVVVDKPEIRIGLDLATIKEINKQAKSDVNITATRMDSGKLTGEAKKAIGNRPIFELKVNYDNDKQVQSFGRGSVSVTIPYTLGINEKADNVQAVYIDGNGQVHWIANSVYDSIENVLHFSTDHFSTYGIGYKQSEIAFTDIATHWAKENIEFVVSYGLFSGTTSTTFSPNTSMTRGMFVTVLGRLANADVDSYKISSFTDVNNDDYYMGYIEWASKNSIINGIGNGKFAPNQSITREQMAVIIQNYVKVNGYKLPEIHAENEFIDSDKVSIYAEDAMKQMQKAGIISGKNGNLFDPQSTATRAEVAAVLHRFIEQLRNSIK